VTLAKSNPATKATKTVAFTAEIGKKTTTYMKRPAAKDIPGTEPMTKRAKIDKVELYGHFQASLF